jgi:hypothetical protein
MDSILENRIAEGLSVSIAGDAIVFFRSRHGVIVIVKKFGELMSL